VRKQKKNFAALESTISSHDREKSLDEECQIFHRKKTGNNKNTK